MNILAMAGAWETFYLVVVAVQGAPHPHQSLISRERTVHMACDGSAQFGSEGAKIESEAKITFSKGQPLRRP